jgi:hypothetical protein
MSYVGVQPVPRATRVRTFGTLVSASNTIAIPGGFSPSNIEVFINGRYVQPPDYNDSDGFNVVFISTTLALGTDYVVMEARTFEVANHYTKVESDAKFVEVGDTVTGTATFTNATNNINLTNIGNIAGLEVGDVIKVSGSVGNNSEFTVEVITDANNVVVNQAHAGGSTTKSLATETSTAGVTVQLLVKWYTTSVGIGQGWLNTSPVRGLEIVYPNATQRSIMISVTVNSSGGIIPAARIEVDGVRVATENDSASGVDASMSVIVPPGSSYEVYGDGTSGVATWAELR